MHFSQHAKQLGLICNWAAENRLAVWLMGNIQPAKPRGPCWVKMSFDSDPITCRHDHLRRPAWLTFQPPLREFQEGIWRMCSQCSQGPAVTTRDSMAALATMAGAAACRPSSHINRAQPGYGTLVLKAAVAMLASLCTSALGVANESSAVGSGTTVTHNWDVMVLFPLKSVV